MSAGDNLLSLAGTTGTAAALLFAVSFGATTGDALAGLSGGTAGDLLLEAIVEQGVSSSDGHDEDHPVLAHAKARGVAGRKQYATISIPRAVAPAAVAGTDTTTPTSPTAHRDVPALVGGPVVRAAEQPVPGRHVKESPPAIQRRQYEEEMMLLALLDC